MALPTVEVETLCPNSSSKASLCSSRVRSSFASRCFGSHSLSRVPFLEGLPGIAVGCTSPVSRRLFSHLFMVGIATEKVRDHHLRDLLPGCTGVDGREHPQSQILRIWFHARRLTHMDQYLRTPLLDAARGTRDEALITLALRTG